jgi:hypothetical protein
MEATLLEFIIYQGIGILFWVWILRWGGADRIEGWRSWALIGWFAGHWAAEQIRFYAFILLGVELVWLAVGIFVPAARFIV